MDSGRERDTRKDIYDKSKDQSEKSTEQSEYLRETIENKANGLRIFEKIKEGLLRETFEILEDNEHGFHNLSEELEKAHEMKMEDYDKELTELERELAGQSEKIGEARRELENVARKFRRELIDYISNTVKTLNREQRETVNVQGDIVNRRDLLRRTRSQLKILSDKVHPSNLRNK